ncbi:hypothetical protein I79_020798 [Cricetulus griseus]|uniref:Uncharacterized protein n=1 Tax=Cricetulus griseus TaxID=10029 RepID=G3IB11_CRIGR|nr:hypothetical protein I79_020798 [Cricetulus griseus]
MGSPAGPSAFKTEREPGTGATSVVACWPRWPAPEPARERYFRGILVSNPPLRLLASGIDESHPRSNGGAPSPSPLCHTQSGLAPG